MSAEGVQGALSGCRAGSLCAPDDPLDLLLARDIDGFEELFHGDASARADPSREYGEPHFMSLLGLACQYDKQDGRFVEVLLNAGADVNAVHGTRGQAAIHVAAKFSNAVAIKALLRCSRTDVNTLDSYGGNVLHVLCDQDHSDALEQCFELVLMESKMNVNLTNRKWKTAIYIAAEKKNKWAVGRLLRHGVELDADKTYDEDTARKIIKRNFPCVFDSDVDSVPISSQKENLMYFLYSRNAEGFEKFLLKKKSAGERISVDVNDGMYTLLQKAVLEGMEEVVDVLLRSEANANKVTENEKRIPTQLAAYLGAPAILKLLLEKGARVNTEDGKTALHYVIQQADPNSPQFLNYQKCFNMLLEHKEGINAADMFGNTPLHMAAKFGNDDFALSLLKSGAYIGSKNKSGIMPVDSIASGTLLTFLNECVMSEKSPRDENYIIIFDVLFLKPPREGVTTDEGESVKITLTDPQQLAECECEPLLQISKIKDLRPILSHPVITSFLDIKWRGIRPFFWINLVFYLLFVALLTIYILFCYESTLPVHGDGINTDSLAMNLAVPLAATTPSTPTNNNTQPDDTISSSGQLKNIVWGIVSTLFVLLALRELFQLIVAWKHYIHSLENYLEFLLLVSCGFVLFYRSADDKLRPHLAAITILLSWAELVLLIGKHPRLSTNIEMFKTVSMNFLKFLAWYSLLIIAFALSFFSLFRNSSADEGDNFFVNPGSSFFKTVVMVTGEFEAGELPFVMFPGTSHVVFVLFVFLVAIVLFNLLNGLAVSDTQAIREDAELVAIVSRIKLISYTEKVLLSHPFWCRRCDNEECCIFQAFSSLRKLSLSRLSAHLDKVQLFPNVLPEGKIFVLPNQDNEIEFVSSGSKQDDNNEACYVPLFYHYHLDSTIVKTAEKILEGRRGGAVVSGTSPGLCSSSSCSHLDRIAVLEHIISQLQQSGQRNQEILQKILQLLENSHNARMIAEA